MPGREIDLHLYHVAFGGSSLLDIEDDESSVISLADHLCDSGPTVMVVVRRGFVPMHENFPDEASQGFSFA